MQRLEVDDYVFILSEHYPGGNVMIQLPPGNQAQTTMDGRSSVSIPTETILKFVANHYVKPSIIARVAQMDPMEILVGSV